MKLVENRDGRGKTPWYQRSLDPHATWVRYWTYLRVGFYIYETFVFPVRFAFGRPHNLVTYFFYVLPDLFFLADMGVLPFLGFKTSAVQGAYVERDVDAIRARYLRWSCLDVRPSFWTDLFALAPIHVAFGFNSGEVLFQFSATPRAARIYKLQLWFSDMEHDVHTDYRKIAILKFGIYLVGMAHWIGLLWWALARASDYDHRSWVAQYERYLGVAIETRSIWHRYQFALLWGLRSMTAFGYGDVVPDVWFECLFAIFVSALQVVFNAYILGTLFHYVVTKDEKAEAFRGKMKSVEMYVEVRRIPTEISARMKQHYAFVLSKETSNRSDMAIIEAMPPALRVRVARWSHRSILNDSQALFSGASDAFINLVLIKLRSRFMLPGELLFKLGDMARELCFLYKGSLEEFEDAEMRRHARTITAGCVGELAFFMGIPQVCGITASGGSDVILQSITKEDYDEVTRLYADGHAVVVNNIVAQYGLDSNGGDIAVSGVQAQTSADAPDKVYTGEKKSSKSSDDFYEARRNALRVTLRRRKDDSLSVMIEAAFEGDIHTVRRIVHQGLDVNTGDYDNRTMLHLASAEGNLKVVKSLLDEGADVHVVDRWGQTPLLDAVRGEHHNVAQLLASYGSTWSHPSPASVLCTLVSDDDLDGLKRAIEYGAPVNAADYDGRTCMHVAAAQGNSGIITFLLHSQVKVNSRDRWGNTPLVDAVKNLHHLPAKILYEAGGEIQQENASALLCDAALKGDQAYLQLLHECGADVRASDYDKRTPLHLAAAEGQLVSVDFLLFAKADALFADRWGNTALDDAIRGKHYECAKLLIGMGGLPGRPVSADVRAKIDAIDLRKVRETVRLEVEKQQRYERKQHQIRDAVKHTSRELAHMEVKFSRLAQSLSVITSHAMRKGGQEAMMLSMRSADAELFAMPVEQPDDDEGSEEGSAGSAHDENNQKKQPLTFCMQRFVGIGLDAPLGAPTDEALLLSLQSLQQAPRNPSVVMRDELARDQRETIDAMADFDSNGSFADVPLLLDEEKLVNPALIRTDPLLEASHNAAVNAGKQLERFDATSHSSKFTSFNQIILVFPVIEHGFMALRSHFDEACSHARFTASGGDDGDDEASDDDDNNRARMLRNNNSSSHQGMPRRSSIQSTTPQPKTHMEITKVELHRLIVASLGMPASRQDLDELCLVEVGLSGGYEAESIDFVHLISSATFMRLINATTAEARKSCSDGCHATVLALEQSYRMVNSAFEMLDRSGKGQITIQELKQSIGGELRSGDELLNLFSRKYIIYRKDFIISLLRWLGIIDEDELALIDDAEEMNKQLDAANDGTAKANFMISQEDIDAEAHRDALRHSFRFGAAGAAVDAVASAVAAAKLSKPSAFIVDLKRSFLFIARHYAEPNFALDTWFVELLASSSGAFVANGSDFVFRDIDKDGDGEIPYDEWKLFVEAAGLRLPHSKSTALYSLFLSGHPPKSYAALLERHIDLKSLENRYIACEAEIAERKLFDDREQDRLEQKRSKGSAAVVRNKPYVIKQGSKIDVGFERLSLFLAAYYTLAVPYMLAFSRFSREEYSGPQAVAIMYSADALLWVTICRKFVTSYANRHSVVVADPIKMRRHYFKTDFAYDFVSALPLDIAIWATSGKASGALWMRLPRLLRLRDVRRTLAHGRHDLRQVRTELQSLFVAILILMHILACIWHALTEDRDGKNWQTRLTKLQLVEIKDDDGYILYGMDAAGVRGGFQLDEYLLSFWWVFSTLTSVGTAYMEAVNVAERWFFMLLMLLNLSLFAYILGTISSLFMSADAQLVAARSEISQTNDFIERHALPAELCGQLRDYSMLQASTKTFSEKEDNDIFLGLSYSLQVDVARHTSRGIIEASRCFTRCTEHFLDTLSTMLRETTASPNAVLFRTRDMSLNLYLVSQGEVSLYEAAEPAGDARPDGVAAAGSAVSPLPFFFGMRQTCTACVSSTTVARLFYLERSDYKRLMKLYPAQEEAIAHNVLDDSAFEEDDNKSSTGTLTSGSGTSSVGGSSHASGTSGVSATEDNKSVMSESSAGGGSTISGGGMVANASQIQSIQSAVAKARSKREKEWICARCAAAAEGRLDDLKSILNLSRATPIDAADYDGRTPLHLAASEGQVAVVSWLIESGTRIDCKDRFGATPYTDAVRHCHDEIAAMLLAAGGSLELSEAEISVRLCSAAAQGDIDGLRRLLEAHNEVDSLDYDARSALHLAACNGHTKVIDFLVNRHANVNQVDRWGGTPLSDAIMMKQVESQRALKRVGAKLPQSDASASSLDQLAADGNIDELRILVENGMDPNNGDYDRRRALHLAACERRLGIVEYLLALPGVDVNVIDRFGGTPLEDAIREGHTSVAMLLERHGAVRSGHASLAANYAENERLSMLHQEQLRASSRAQEQSYTAVDDTCARLQDVVAKLSTDVRLLQKEMHALSLHSHPKQWKSKKAIGVVRELHVADAVDHVFRVAFRKYMRMRAHAEKLLNAFLACQSFAKRPRSAAVDEIVDLYLAKGARHEIHTAPKSLGKLLAVADACFQKGDTLPVTLFDDIQTEVGARLAKHVRKFQSSSFCKQVLNSRTGRLWRTLEACRNVSGGARHVREGVIDALCAILESDVVTANMASRATQVPQLLGELRDFCRRLEELGKSSERLAVGNRLIFERALERDRVLNRADDARNPQMVAAGADAAADKAASPAEPRDKPRASQGSVGTMDEGDFDGFAYNDEHQE